MGDQIRYPAGLLGTYYAARHDLKSYRSCAVTATYSVPSSTDVLQLLFSALHLTIQQHSILRYGVSSPPNPSFILQKRIDFSSVLKILPETTQTLDDRPLTKALEEAHGELFTDPENIPSWRIRVLPYQKSGSKRKIEVLFLSHHAIADGLSCLAFHASLLTHLQTVTQNGTQAHPEYYIVSQDSAGPDLIEAHVKFSHQNPQSTVNISDAIFPTSVPVWPNTKCPVATSGNYQSRVLILNIPSTQLRCALSYSKANGVTLTALLHGMLTSQLTKLLPEAQSFAAISPYTMRSFTGAPSTAIVNHVSYIKSTWSSDLISALRASVEGSEEEAGVILMIARLFRAEIAAELSKCPQGNPWCKLAAVDDVMDYCRAASTSTRNLTYELSNLGTMKVPLSSPVDGDEGVHIERCTFSQCGMIDPPIGINTVSCGGGMVLTFTWREGAVDEKVMINLKDGIAKDFETFEDQE